MVTDTSATIQTKASKILEQGGALLPPKALEAFHQREMKQIGLNADAKISAQYRLEQLAAVDDATERALQTARDQDVVADRKPIESAIGQILAEIKGNVASSTHMETQSVQAERLALATRAAIELNTDVLAASASTDPDHLRDLLEEAIEQSSPDIATQSTQAERLVRTNRVRRLAPVIIARLAELSSQKVVNANDYWALAITAYGSWRKATPSAAARLRDARERLAQVESEVDRKYVRARQAFRFGVHANGIQM